jgi:tetratricopeptide (TPR) repeat protein
VSAGGDVVAELRGRLARYDPDRYPVQHATARFHLGAALLQSGAGGEAVEELATAVAGFRGCGMPAEHAKATMMLGVALRETGRLDEAAEVLLAAAELLGRTGLRSEGAAAQHNLGVVARDRGDLKVAAERFMRAVAAFGELDDGPSRSAAQRELGGVLLQQGSPAEAIAPLAAAMAEAGDRGDAIAFGAAANVLGLARLALEDAVGAEEAFRAAVSASPRTLRPESYAMAKANLALALEAGSAVARARLAARQARDEPAAPAPVVAQAREVLERLGDPDDDLLSALADEPGEGWQQLLRDEVARWAVADEGERRRSAAGWVAGLPVRGELAPDLLHAWLDAVLELPPTALERIIAATVAAWADLPDEAVRERFRSLVARGLPRFHLPQWQRLEASFERLSAAAGHPVAWR